MKFISNNLDSKNLLNEMNKAIVLQMKTKSTGNDFPPPKGNLENSLFLIVWPWFKLIDSEILKKEVSTYFEYLSLTHDNIKGKSHS